MVDAHYRGSASARPIVFTLRELLGQRTVARYRPKGGTVGVFLRHNTSDGNILQEFAMHGLYDEPDPVRLKLVGIERPVVVDLGGHIGLFGAHVLTQYPDASVTSVEADPANAALLRRTAAASGREWRVIEAAASTAAGTVTFAGGRFAESRIDPDGEPTEAIDAFELLASCDLAKIDIEGGEWDLLQDPRLSRLRCALILEWHPHGCPTGDPETVARGTLERADFRTASVVGSPPGVGMIWAWRE